MPELTPRVVFDCNLFVQGIANRNSPARKALRLFFNGDISLFVSEPIIREVRDVLNRAELRHKLPGINDRIVNAFLTKQDHQRRFSSLTSPKNFITNAIPMTRCILILPSSAMPHIS
jgi:predicted nucleic acid-binding protein